MKKILLLINIVFITLFHNNASAQGVIDSVIATQYIECPGEDGCLTVYTTGNDYTVVLQQANSLLQMQTVATSATFASSVEQFCGLSSGIYQVLLTDVNYTLPYPTGFNFDPNSNPGIFDAVTAILMEPLPLAVNLTAGNVSANGACDGWLNASVSGGTVPYTYLWDDNAVFPQTTQTATNLCGGTYCVTVTDTFGCLDTSCFSVIINQTYGCTDPTACNYDPLATIDDGSCLTVYGCIDSTALNYQASATCDDGSCIFFSTTLKIDTAFISQPILCNGGFATDEIQIEVNQTSPTTVYSVIIGFYSGNPSTPIPGTNYFLSYVSTNQTSATTLNFFGFNPGVNYYVRVVDSTAYYTSTGSGSGTSLVGIYDEVGPINFTEPTQLEYTIYNVVDESSAGACDGEIWVNVTGGTGNYYYDIDQLGNFPFNNPAQLINDSLIDNLCAGLHSIYITDDNNCQGFVFWGGSWTDSIGTIPPTIGCTDPSATNYDPLATVDDGSCIYPTWDCNNGVCSDPGTGNGTYASLAACQAACVGFGCTDPIACNYDASATVDDGSCIYISNPAVDMTVGSWTLELFNYQNGCTSSIGTYPNEVFYSSGSTFAGTISGAASQYLWSMCGNTFIMYSTSDEFVGTYSNGVITGYLYDSSGSIPFCFTLTPNSGGTIYGCTDPIACNYDASATVDDGSCSYGSSSVSTASITACDGYIAGDGTVYTTSQTFTDLATNIYGCDSIVLVTLTINNSTTNTTIISASGSYTWSGPLGDGNTYFTSGTYANVSTNAAGCDHTEILVLTINTTLIYGCTDLLANNYDAYANTDDGSCIYSNLSCFIIADPSKLSETTIGTTTYDLQSNASLQNRIVVHDDGTISAGWTMSQQYNTTYSDRGTGYNFFDGTSWGAQPTTRLESSRGGWPSIIALGNGGECAITHNTDNSLINNTSRTTIGSGSWTENTVTPDYLIWNRSATGGIDGNTIHMIGVTASSNFGGTPFNGLDGALVYYRSQDGGINWDITDMQLPGMDTSMYNGMSGDVYAIAAQENTVVVAYFDDWGDSYIVKSTDNGNTWTKTTFLDFPVDKYAMDDGLDLDNNGIMDKVYSTDNYGALILDDNGDAHVFYGIMRYADDDLADASFSWFPTTNGIAYWNESYGADTTPSTVQDPSLWYSDMMNDHLIAHAPDLNGDGQVSGIDSVGGYSLYYASRASMPSAGIDSLGNLYLSYSGYTETADNGTQVFRHIYVTKSEDGGDTWSCPVNVTPHDAWNGMQECVFGSMSPVVDDKIRIVYQKDFEPGLAARGDEDMVDNNDIVYLEVSVSVFDTSIYGCTDPLATNYDPLATVDDGSCIYCNISNTFMYTAPSTSTSCDGFILSSASSSFPITNYNWVNSQGSFMGSSNFISNICNDAYILTLTDSAGCTFVDTLILGTIFGCTDPLATNYNPFASVDDGSCLYPTVYGCTDSLAYNYNPIANTDDGSCQYCDLSVNLFVNQNSTPTACDGFIVITTAPTSNGPVSYLWSTGSTQNNLTGLCTGTYTLTVTDAVGCTIDTTINIGNIAVYGCTDPLASNYDPLATIDDGSCTYITTCSNSSITGLFISDIIDDQVLSNFDNMNTYDSQGNQICRVDQIRIKYREVGTSAWSQKNIASPTGYDPITGVCNSTQKTDKAIRNLTPATEYEWQVKVWYCNGGNGGWAVGPNFTTLGECPNVGNLTAYGANPTKATFDWDDSNGSYEFARIKMRVDSISNPQGSDWFLVGGSGVSYPTFTKNKNGLVAGETYRGQARTWCDPNGGAYNSLSWTSLVTWTQPATIKVEGGTSIANLDVYPNPSRDVFNISFTSESIQDLRVRILNVVGEVIALEELEQFIGEYTKQINLEDNAKGIYFLEIETNDGIINKKLILQ